MFDLRPEPEIEAMLLEQIADIKRWHLAWQDPHTLCKTLGVRLILLPRATVLAAIARQGFSVSLIETLSSPEGPSRTAVCLQLAACARHRCVAVVCRSLPTVGSGQVAMPGSSTPGRTALTVALAINSASMRYRVARGTHIPAGHLLHEAYQAGCGDWVRGKAPIPFRSNSPWEVDCEAMRLGRQVFALFHADPPPTATTNQMRLPL